MHLLLIRHGSAIDMSLAATDSVRWLTPGGRFEVQNVATQLKQTLPTLSAIYTSPLVRAVQTAEVLAAVCDFGGPIESHPALGTDEGTTAQALAPLNHASDDDTILFVSHMPKVSTLAGHLTGNANFPAFPTAGAALIDLSTNALQWMIAPNMV